MLRDVLGLFPQGRHHPTALFVLRSLVPLVGEERVGGMFRGTGVKLTQLVPGTVGGGWGCISGVRARVCVCAHAHVFMVCPVCECVVA